MDIKEAVEIIRIRMLAQVAYDLMKEKEEEEEKWILKKKLKTQL